jgi:hypothetical protein
METLKPSDLRVALHELNNVFTIIVSSADLMLLDAMDNSQASQDLRNILKACDRGKRLVEDLRAKSGL